MAWMFPASLIGGLVASWVTSLFSKGADEEKKALAKRINDATTKTEEMKSEVVSLQSKLDLMKAQAASQASLRDELKDAMTAQIASQASLRDELQKAMREISAQLLEAQEAMKRGIDAKFAPTDAEIFRAKKRLRYRDGYFHIAIAGRSGTGKSSLINALRVLRDKDQGAARVGYIETTMDIGRFESPNPGDKVVWYDIPGAGTLNIPRWDYFKNQCLYMFDAVILAWDSRLMDTDVAILTHCENLKIPCFVVRSKCDSVLQTIRKDIEEELEDEGIYNTDDEFYEQFNSRYERAKTDFRRTTQTFFDDLCKDQGLPQCKTHLVSARCIYGVLRAASQSPGTSASRESDALDVLDEQPFLHAFCRWVAQ